MKRTGFLLLAALIFSCSNKESQTSLFQGCGTSKIDLSNGIEVSDTMNYFKFNIPDSSWKPTRFFQGTQNGIIVGDTSKRYFRGFAANQNDFQGGWDWVEEQKSIEKIFNVLESGLIEVNEKREHYNIVLFENQAPPQVSLYVTIVDEPNKRFYTLELTTIFSDDYKSDICELLPFLESFYINN